MNQYIAIDRDGCLVSANGRLNNYPNNSPSSYKTKEMPIIWQTCTKLKELDLPIIIISNQAGIQSGYTTIELVTSQFIWLMDELLAYGMPIIGSIFCPDYGESAMFIRAKKLPSGNNIMFEIKNKQNQTGMRKPDPGMGYFADKFAYDLADCEECWGYIGDLSGRPGYAPTAKEPNSDAVFADNWGVKYIDVFDFVGVKYEV